MRIDAIFTARVANFKGKSACLSLVDIRGNADRNFELAMAVDSYLFHLGARLFFYPTSQMLKWSAGHKGWR
jgi:hypothetical protein